MSCPKPRGEYAAAGFSQSCRWCSGSVAARRARVARRGRAAFDLVAIRKSVDQHREGSRWLTSAWIVQMIARKGCAPVGEHLYKAPVLDQSLDLILGQIGKPESRKRCFDT